MFKIGDTLYKNEGFWWKIRIIALKPKSCIIEIIDTTSPIRSFVLGNQRLMHNSALQKWIKVEDANDILKEMIK